MNKHLGLIVASASFLILGLTAVSRSGDKLELEPGFVRLDNGKDLEGWTGKLDGWSVADGAIHLDSKKAKGDIYSVKTHGGDAVIRLQFRATKGADSGVYIHGKQLQVRDYPNAGPKEYAKAAKPFGQWNDLEFEINGGVAVVRLNGQVIEKAWKIGGDAKKGVGLQRERGDFDFRFVRMKVN
jgi:hypothetical protein